MATVRSLSRNVLECFVAVEMLGTASVVGICAFGYIGSHRAFAERKAVLVQNTGGRIELATLASISAISASWRRFDQVIVHSSARYLLARLEMAKADVGKSLGYRLISALGGADVAIVTEEVDDPNSPRMAEAIAFSKSGRPTIELTLENE